MLIRFSVTLTGGVERISYKPAQSPPDLVNPDLFSGMMEALQMLSQEIGAPIQALKLGNTMLYVRPYEEYTIRLQVDEELKAPDLDRLFDALSGEIIEFLPDIKTGQILPDDLVEEHFVPILNPLLQDLSPDTTVQEVFPDVPIPKIAIVGIASAGKTTIKNMFLEKMPAEIARKTSPTLGVEVSRKFSDFLEDKIFVADFGGQSALRQQYLNQEHLWRDISVLIFVVDIQDAPSFMEASEYLACVWDVVVNTNLHAPHLSILFHKYDEEKRTKLASNIQEALAAFHSFLGFASFYMTTIDDQSCNLALIQSLYFTLPDVMIKRLLEQEFLHNFEADLLPRFARLVADPSQPLPASLLAELRSSASLFGRTYGLSLQDSWLKYLTGEYTPPNLTECTGTLCVSKHGTALHVTISNYVQADYSPDLAKILLEGILDGISHTFHLASPQIVEEGPDSVTWQIGTEKLAI